MDDRNTDSKLGQAHKLVNFFLIQIANQTKYFTNLNSDFIPIGYAKQFRIKLRFL